VVEAVVKVGRALVVWIVLTVLLAIVVAIEYRDVMASRSARASRVDANMLVPVPVDQIGAIEIAEAGTLHRFERNAAGAWFYHGVHSGSEGAHEHATDTATAARIEQAFQAFGRTRMERRLPPGTDPQRHGLTAPRILVIIYRRNEREPLVQYAVGDLAPDTVSRYVDMVGGAGIVTIPSYQVDNLLNLVVAVRTPSPAR
jgi:hypothetical protein